MVPDDSLQAGPRNPSRFWFVGEKPQYLECGADSGARPRYRASVMRIPTTIVCLAVIAILASGCASTSGTSGTNSGGAKSGAKAGTAKRSEPDRPAAPTKGVTGKPIRMEWRNLNPRHGEQRMGLINRSSPDLALLYRRPGDFKSVKPVEDEVMANMLSAVRESDYFKLAKKDSNADDFEMGDAHGVVWVRIGDESWTLVFRAGDGGRDSQLPRTYRDIKVLIMNVHSQTLWFSTSTSGGEKTFKIAPHKYQPPR